MAMAADSVAVPPLAFGFRQLARQCTSEEVKSMRPLATERLGTGLCVDRLLNFRVQAKYPQEAQLKHVAPEVLDALPDEYKQNTKSWAFGKFCTPEKEEECLENALERLWAKHFHIYGEERPEWTMPPVE